MQDLDSGRQYSPECQQALVSSSLLQRMPHCPLSPNVLYSYQVEDAKARTGGFTLKCPSHHPEVFDMTWVPRVDDDGLSVQCALSAVDTQAAQAGSKSVPQSDLEPMASVEELLKGIEEQHPSTYYALASQLLLAGRGDEAVFWYYAGQLRWRYYAVANSATVDGSEEASLMAALHQSVGKVVNEYAFGDLSKLRSTIDAVIAWDEATPNGYFSKEQAGESRDTVLQGLRKLRQQTIDDADEIMRTRKSNGLKTGSKTP